MLISMSNPFGWDRYWGNQIVNELPGALNIEPERVKLIKGQISSMLIEIKDGENIEQGPENLIRKIRLHYRKWDLGVCEEKGLSYDEERHAIIESLRG